MDDAPIPDTPDTPDDSAVQPAPEQPVDAANLPLGQAGQDALAQIEAVRANLEVMKSGASDARVAVLAQAIGHLGAAEDQVKASAGL